MATEGGDEYAYDALSTGYIRLLKISLAADETPICEMRHWKLDSGVRWQALSYVWGQKVRSKHILVFGDGLRMGDLTVTPNLFNALISIYNNVMANNIDWEWIWIDAICIDQANDAEKATQIPLMGRIYQDAALVFIWLGLDADYFQPISRTLLWLCADWYLGALDGQSVPEEFKDILGLLSTQNLDVSFSSLRSIWTAKRNALSSMLERDDFITTTQLMAFRSLVEMTSQAGDSCGGISVADQGALEHLLLPSHHPFWIALVEFMVSDWFNRVWTYQEVCLARAPVLLLEDGVIPWPVIYHCRKATGNAVFPVDVFALQRRGHDAHQIAIRLRQTVYGFGVELDSGKLRPLLQHVLARNATNAKDCIYGVLGMVDEKTRSSITIDYAMSTARVYMSACKTIVDDDASNLPWLWNTFDNNSGNPEVVDDLPSWCPNFTITVPGHVAQHLRLSNNVVQRFKKHAEAKVNILNNSVKCKVLLLDQILRCSEKFCSLDTKSWFNFCDDVIETKKDLLALWIKADYDEGFLRLWDFAKTKHLGKLFWWMLNATRHDNIGAFLDMVQLHDAIRRDDWDTAMSIREQGDVIGNIYFAESRFLEHFRNRCIFETTSGRFGFAERQIMEGDHIALLPGGEALFVLSADQKHYRCPAYVNSLMGDALLETPSGIPLVWTTVDLY